jgi:hypothetical protein
MHMGKWLAAKTFVVVAVGLIAAPGIASAKVQSWVAGWDIVSEPLDYANSSITWKVNQTTKLLTITYLLKGAKPNKLYQVGAHIFNLCPSPPALFGQFPVSACGATGIVSLEFGVVTTDASGNGTFSVVIGPVASGSYKVEFHARNGAGCGLAGGGSDCSADFQSPGPFGTATKIRVE